jgi:MFS family permease
VPGTATIITNRHSSRAALTLALCAPADTLLYLLLPMHPSVFGVTLAQAGVLLAANRLVRIGGYRHVVRYYAKFGDRPVCVLASSAAALCAFGYATFSGFWWLLVLRLVWGLSFAGLNLSTQVLATSEPSGAARRAGRSRAVFALGPMIALPIGASLSMRFGPRAIFFLLCITSLIGALLARNLPSDAHEMTLDSGRRIRWPDSVAAWSFIEGVILDGLFIVGLSLETQKHIGNGAVLVAGSLLALRYASEVLLSPFGGRAAHRWGSVRMLVIFSLMSGLALIGYGSYWLVPCGAAVLILRALQLPLVMTVVAQRHPGHERIQALASNSVWRDIGAGVGPLLAGIVLPISAPSMVYSVALSVSAIACGLQYGEKAPERSA